MICHLRQDVTVLRNKSHAALRVAFGRSHINDQFGDSRDPGHRTDSGRNVVLTLVLGSGPDIQLDLKRTNLYALKFYILCV
jgi:hypothetical protein